MTRGTGGPPRITTSLLGRRALVVPVLPCEQCDQDMPADHPCPATDLRRSSRLAADTVHPSPHALETIRARIHQDTAATRAPRSERDTTMTSPTDPAHSRHTVPALQEMAGNVRDKAKRVQAEADELHRAADEIAAIAAQLQAVRPPERPCDTCGRAMFNDGPGWQHKNYPHLPCPAPRHRSDWPPAAHHRRTRPSRSPPSRRTRTGVGAVPAGPHPGRRNPMPEPADLAALPPEEAVAVLWAEVERLRAELAWLSTAHEAASNSLTATIRAYDEQRRRAGRPEMSARRGFTNDSHAQMPIQETR